MFAPGVYGRGSDQPAPARQNRHHSRRQSHEQRHREDDEESNISDMDNYEDIDAKSDVSSLDEFEQFDFDTRNSSRASGNSGVRGLGFNSPGGYR